MGMQYDVKQLHLNTSGTAVSYRTRLKSIVVTSATISARNIGICDPTVYQTGTYSRTTPSSTTTVTITGHGLETGDRVFLDFTTGTARDGMYDITKVNDNSFTVDTVQTTSTSGNVTMYTTILLELDTFSTVGLPVYIPGEGILCKNGIFAGLGSSVTLTIYYG